MFITKQPDKGRSGRGDTLSLSLRYMNLQQGMTVDFSLLGFCELFVKMGIDFKYFDLLKGMVYSKIKYVTTTFLFYSTSPEKKLTVIKLKLFCKVVTNQSATENLRNASTCFHFISTAQNKANNSASGLKDSGKNKT